MKKPESLFSLLFVSAFLLLSFTVFGQSHDTTAEHEFKNFRIAVNLGHAHIPSASFGKDRNFAVVPVWGFDFQYWFNPKWGLALKNDIEIANYVVDDENNGAIIRNNPVIIALPVLFSPWDNQFTFIIGPGIELESHENFFVFRAGIGSEFEVGNHWDFAPEIIYDLKDGHINSFTIAIGVGKKF